jgi:superfamily II DNA or RNA helicase
LAVPFTGQTAFSEAPGTVTGRSRYRANRRAKLNINFEALASSEAAGCATSAELDILRANPAQWIDTLRRLLAETEAALRSAAHITGPEKAMVLEDLTGERDALRRSLHRLAPERHPEPKTRPEKRPSDDVRPAAPDLPPTPPALQGSWHNGRIVLWAGSASAPLVAAGELDRLMAEAGASSIAWEPHGGIPLPAGGPVPSNSKALAMSAPVGDALGWLVGVGAGQLAVDAGPSLRWLGRVAVWATELVAQGRVVPSLVEANPNAGGKAGRTSTGEYMVRWAPAVLEPDRLKECVSKMPGAVSALEQAGQPYRMCRAVLGAAADAVCRAGAARLVTPATVPVARSRSEVSEAVLAGLAGEPFTAAARAASEMADDMARWTTPVTSDRAARLTVRLAPPEEDGGWMLTVESSEPGPNGEAGPPEPVEDVLHSGRPARAAAVETELRRLERLLPALRRPGRRRGRVVVDGTEAWELMTVGGAVLEAAGFTVRVPLLAKKRSTPRLQLTAEAFGGESVVGAQQLSRVQWSVAVDDVTLDAAAIAKLAAQARPLVQTKGGWVELDKADLEAAAAALAERSKVKELSGAAILRHAVGLEGGVGGPVLVEGGGWAVDLVRGAAAGAARPLPAPDGFVGELRHYQAEARGWLGFLDRAGLGGCLAMDMGLGKTPTVLAHILEHRGGGPALVIAPPAVLGNWAAEAARFTPELTVQMHHGTGRAAGEDVAGEAAEADIVLTTYATAVRDVEELAKVEWSRLIVDEAQAIKNPASDTAQELRRIPARCRLALTGTPVENGLGDLWSILDFTNPGLVGPRAGFVEALSRPRPTAEATAAAAAAGNGPARSGEQALRALNGLLVFRRTKAEPEIAAELPDKIDELDHCAMTPEQVGLYQAVLDNLLAGGPGSSDPGSDADSATAKKGHVLAAITHLKQICDHPAAYVNDDNGPLDGRSGKLARLEELIEAVFEAGERMLVFTHFARWGERLATHLTKKTGLPIACYHGGLTRTQRDRLVKEFQEGSGAGALVVSIKAGGTGLNLTAASHVVLYDRWWNPAVEDQARDRAWRIGQAHTVICHRLVCPGTVDERVEEVVAGKRRIADLVLPASSSLGDLSAEELRLALGLRPDAIVEEVARDGKADDEEAA